MATLERASPRSSAAAITVAIMAGISLLLSLLTLRPLASNLGPVVAGGASGLALLSIAGTLVGLVGAALVLLGALLSLRGGSAGAPLVRWTAAALVLYTLAAAAASELLVRRAGSASVLQPRAAFAGLLGALLAGVLWWGLIWLLARRL